MNKWNLSLRSLLPNIKISKRVTSKNVTSNKTYCRNIRKHCRNITDTLDVYARTNSSVLSFLRREVGISDEQIETVLDKTTRNYARWEFEAMTNQKAPRTYAADHVTFPDAFAYALTQGEFSPAEMACIPFDHCETVASYQTTYSKPQFLRTLREKLLNPPARKNAQKPSASYCASCCD